MRGHGGAAGLAQDGLPAAPREGTEGVPGGPHAATGGGTPAGEESYRRIPLDATRPGAGLAPEERELFLGGALTRAKRDTGGVGVRPLLRVAMPWQWADAEVGWAAVGHPLQR